jgi:Domain of unknown function (DUF6089)
MIIYNSVVRKTFGFISLFVLPVSVLAQKWEVGIGAGICNYKGDIMPSFKPFVARPGGSAFVRMNWTRSISLKAQGMFGGLAGNDKAIKSDPYHQARGHSFTAVILEGIGQIEYNFANFRTTSSRVINNWTPYVFGGYGGTTVQTKAKLASINNALYLTRSSPNFVALGIGFKKEWRNQWNWGVEFGSRWTNTDLIDAVGYERDGDISQTTTVGSPPAIIYPYLFQKNQTPGTKAKDMYYYTNFSISYLFYKVHCPTRR